MERDQATKFMHDLLRLMVSKNGSDLFITAEFPPAFKIDGKMTPVSTQPLLPAHTTELAHAIMNDKQAAEFESTKECNFAISPGGLGRFRVSAFVQQGRIGMVLRTITTAIPKLEDLKVPEILKEVALTKRGLVIMVGATGSGKSSTLPPWSAIATKTATATSSRSKTRSNTSIRTATASSRNAKSVSIRRTGAPR